MTPKVWQQLKGSHGLFAIAVGDPPRHLTRKGSDSIWQGALKERLKVARMLSIMEFKSEGRFGEMHHCSALNVAALALY